MLHTSLVTNLPLQQLCGRTATPDTEPIQTLINNMMPAQPTNYTELKDAYSSSVSKGSLTQLLPPTAVFVNLDQF